MRGDSFSLFKACPSAPTRFFSGRPTSDRSRSYPLRGVVCFSRALGSNDCPFYQGAFPHVECMGLCRVHLLLGSGVGFSSEDRFGNVNGRVGRGLEGAFPISLCTGLQVCLIRRGPGFQLGQFRVRFVWLWASVFRPRQIVEGLRKANFGYQGVGGVVGRIRRSDQIIFRGVNVLTLFALVIHFGGRFKRACGHVREDASFITRVDRGQEFRRINLFYLSPNDCGLLFHLLSFNCVPQCSSGVEVLASQESGYFRYDSHASLAARYYVVLRVFGASRLRRLRVIFPRAFDIFLIQGCVYVHAASDPLSESSKVLNGDFVPVGVAGVVSNVLRGWVSKGVIRGIVRRQVRACGLASLNLVSLDRLDLLQSVTARAWRVLVVRQGGAVFVVVRCPIRRW